MNKNSLIWLKRSLLAQKHINMNPQLQNYINQARSVGQTDAQIRQTLVAQGWTETNLNEAFGQSPVNVPAALVSSAGSSWLSAKVIVVAVVVLLIGGIGTYIRSEE